MKQILNLGNDTLYREFPDGDQPSSWNSTFQTIDEKVDKEIEDRKLADVAIEDKLQDVVNKYVIDLKEGETLYDGIVKVLQLDNTKQYIINVYRWNKIWNITTNQTVINLPNNVFINFVEGFGQRYINPTNAFLTYDEWVSLNGEENTFNLINILGNNQSNNQNNRPFPLGNDLKGFVRNYVSNQSNIAYLLFKNTDFSNSIFDNTSLYYNTFENCIFDNMQHPTGLNMSKLINCRGSNVNIGFGGGNNYLNSEFVNSSLKNFGNAEIKNCKFINCDLSNGASPSATYPDHINNDWSGSNLTNFNIVSSTLTNNKFIGTILKTAIVQCVFINCDFTNAILDGFEANGSTFNNSIFKNSTNTTYIKLSGVTFNNSNLSDLNLLAQYSGLNLRKTELNNVSFTMNNNYGSGIVFDGIVYNNGSFEHLGPIQIINKSIINNVVFSQGPFSGTQYSNIVLKNCTISNSDLSGITWTDCDLSGTSITSSNMGGGNITNCNVDNAILNFSAANGSRFTNIDFQKIKSFNTASQTGLNSTTFTNCNFKGVTLPSWFTLDYINTPSNGINFVNVVWTDGTIINGSGNPFYTKSETDALLSTGGVNFPETPSKTKFLRDDNTFIDIATGGAISTGWLYTSNVVSPVNSAYKQLTYDPTTTGQVINVSGTSTSPTLVEQFLFDSPIGVSMIPTGVWSGWAKRGVNNTSGDSHIRIVPFLYQQDGTTIDLSSYDGAPIKDTSVTDGQPFEKALLSRTCNPTDRLGVKVYFVTTRTVSTTLSILLGYVEGLRFSVPLPSRHNTLRDLNGDDAYQHVSKNWVNWVETDLNYVKGTMYYEREGSTLSDLTVTLKINKQTVITASPGPFTSSHNITINLETPTSAAIMSESILHFATGDSIPNVNFPSNMRWLGGNALEMNPNKNYTIVFEQIQMNSDWIIKTSWGEY